jgi:hypothetical protein
MNTTQNVKLQADKTTLFLTELNTFISKINAETPFEDIELHPYFYAVLTELEKLDSNFNVETGMDLREHLKFVEESILFSDKLIEALEKSSVE